MFAVFRVGKNPDGNGDQVEAGGEYGFCIFPKCSMACTLDDELGSQREQRLDRIYDRHLGGRSVDTVTSSRTHRNAGELDTPMGAQVRRYEPAEAAVANHGEPHLHGPRYVFYELSGRHAALAPPSMHHVWPVT